jgi:hypothetical protein
VFFLKKEKSFWHRKTRQKTLAHAEITRVLQLVFFAQSTSGLFYFRRTTFSSDLKVTIGNTLVKSTSLRINLNIDGTPSRLLTSSLSLGVPVPRTTQCILDVLIPQF